jgi:hypothetical protein
MGGQMNARYGWVMVALGAVAMALAFPAFPRQSVPLNLKEAAT